MSDKKILIVIAIITLAILGGAVIFLSNTSSSSTKAILQKTVGAKIETSETNFDFKDILYSKGDAIHKFKIKNIGDKPLSIANMATSCHCTKVFFKNIKGESPKFEMKGSVPSNWVGIINPGEEGQVVSDFDPTFHGPQGVGPISRIISFETNDPDHPYVELSFSGNVVKN